MPISYLDLSAWNQYNGYMNQNTYPVSAPAAGSAALAKAFLNKVYLWMAACMLLTAGVAAYTAQDVQSLTWTAQNTGLLCIGTIGTVVVMSFGANRLSATSLAALLMVFAVLTLLWGVLAIFKYFFYDIPKRKKEDDTHTAEETLESMAPATPAPAPVPVPVAASPATDDAALVAAITAAIAAALAEDGYTGGFRVVSFRRADTSRAWNRK